MKLEPSHVPNNNHILLITLDPLFITHLKPLQCGDDVKNGEIINPLIVFGVQNLTYE
jgi:hypothetical protein